MRSGLLRKRVVLEQLVETQDAFNQPVKTWTVVGTYWAAVRYLSGDESPNAGQVRAIRTIEVLTRYIGPIDPKWRLVYGSRIFNLVDVENVEEQNREYKLVCKEAVTPP